MFSSAYWTGFFTGFMAIPALVGYLMTQVHATCGYLMTQVHAMCFAASMFACALGLAAAYSLLYVVVSPPHRPQVSLHHTAH